MSESSSLSNTPSSYVSYRVRRGCPITVGLGQAPGGPRKAGKGLEEALRGWAGRGGRPPHGHGRGFAGPPRASYGLRLRVRLLRPLPGGVGASLTKADPSKISAENACGPWAHWGTFLGTSSRRSIASLCNCWIILQRVRLRDFTRPRDLAPMRSRRVTAPQSPDQ